MKKLGLVIALVGMLAIASCGGSSGTPTTTQGMINSSLTAFGDLVDAAFTLADQGGCTAKATWDCSAACSNAGGVLDLDDAALTATLVGCQQDGLSFSGTVQAQGDDAVINLTAAGSCTSFDGTLTDTGDTTPNCSGTFNFVCNGETGTCNISTDCNSCTIQ